MSRPGCLAFATNVGRIFATWEDLLTPLPSGDDHAFGVAVIDALIEIAMGNDGLEVRVFEGFEGFLET